VIQNVRSVSPCWNGEANGIVAIRVSRSLAERKGASEAEEQWLKPNEHWAGLFNFLVNRVLIAMRTKLVEFQPTGGIPTIFHGRVAGHTGRSLVGIGAALGTFQRDNNTDPFVLSHNPMRSEGNRKIRRKHLLFHTLLHFSK
jgi:hypothetical protein